MTNPFVFIVGCPRSGTTLLQRIVNAHPRIAIIPEIGWIIKRSEQRAFVTLDGMVRPALIQELIQKRALGRYTRLPMSRNELERLLLTTHHCPVSYSELITSFFDRYGESKGKSLVGNKTVDHVRNIFPLHQLWPQTKFIHLIRDGRDVCLSANQWRRAERLANEFSTWREDPISTAALWWEWQVRLGREAGQRIGNNLYHEIRYEELVANPAQVCQSLCDFLGVPYDEAMLQFHQGREKSDSELDAKHAWLPPTPGLRDWRIQMTRPDLTRFEAVAGELLDELGYPREVHDLTLEGLQHASQLRQAFEGRPMPQHWERMFAAEQTT